MFRWESVLGAGDFGLIRNDHHVDRALVERAFDISAMSVSTELVVHHPEGWRSPVPILRKHRLLIDIDVLFWRDVGVDPLRLLAQLARQGPLMAVWPGVIQSRRVTYSTPGRSDYYDGLLPDEAVVLRLKPSTFGDEVPYEVERI